MFIIIIIIFLGIVNSSINPDYYDEIQVEKGDRLAKEINYHRKKTDAVLTQYIYSENVKFSLYKETYGSEWFSEKNNMNWSLVSPTIKNSNRTLTHNAVFLFNWATFDQQGRESWKWLFSISKKTNFKQLLRRGESCYDFWKCDHTKFTNYVSCMNKNCVVAENLVYPKIINPSLWTITSVDDTENIHVYGRVKVPSTDRYN